MHGSLFKSIVRAAMPGQIVWTIVFSLSTQPTLVQQKTDQGAVGHSCSFTVPEPTQERVQDEKVSKIAKHNCQEEKKAAEYEGPIFSDAWEA